MQKTHIQYKVDDGTGVIEVKKWTDEAQQERIQDGSMPNLPKQDEYVKVFGNLKEFNNRRHVGAQFVRPISDFNEISHHFLEATLVHLQLTREPVAQNGAANGNGDAMDTYAGNGAGGGPAGLNQVSANAKKVYEVIKTEPQGHEGVSVEVIANKLGMDINTAQKAGDELCTQGLTFATGDEGTWAIMDMFQKTPVCVMKGMRI